MNVSQLAEVVEINLFFAKSELCQMSDPSAPARALRHIEEALQELRDIQRATKQHKNEPETVSG